MLFVNKGYFVFYPLSILILISFFVFYPWVWGLYADSFPLVVGNTTGNISSGQVLQYERSSCIVDNNCQYEEYHESYVKVDGGMSDRFKGKDESGFAPISTQTFGLSRLGKSHGSFKGIKEHKHTLEDKTQENTLKPGLRRLLPSVSFNDKIPNGSSKNLLSHKKQSSLFRLSFKRRSSCDVEEATELCK